jgi:hypothetical protein
MGLMAARIHDRSGRRWALCSPLLSALAPRSAVATDLLRRRPLRRPPSHPSACSPRPSLPLALSPPSPLYPLRSTLPSPVSPTQVAKIEADTVQTENQRRASIAQSAAELRVRTAETEQTARLAEIASKQVRTAWLRSCRRVLV